VLEDGPVACSFVGIRGYAGCAVLALRGELDISDRAELSSWLAAAVSCGPWVIVDLADLAFIDCSSLGVLACAREQAQLAGGDMLLAGPRGVVARLLVLLTGRAGEFSVFPGVGVAAFSAGLAAFGLRLAAARRRESLAAATEGMVTAAAASRAVNAPAPQDPRAISVQLARVTKGQSRLPRVPEVGCSAALSAMICPIPKLTVLAIR
jgi:anti-anti-sigma factor